MSLSTELQHLLTETFHPDYLKIINESPSHHVPEGAETHFKIIMVAPAFSTLSLVKRHQEVYKLLKPAMDYQGLHAISLHTHSPEEWAKKQHDQEPETPPCRGGRQQEAP